MNNQSANYLQYTEALKRLDNNEVVHDVVSIGSTTSLLFPTLRWKEPAFTFFAGSSLLRRGAPVRRGPPDFWGAFEARTFRVLILAQFDVVPFVTEMNWEVFEMPDFKMTFDELDDQRTNLAGLMDAVVPDFFLEEDGSLESRQSLSLLLSKSLPGPLLEQSMCLAPDFFGWLSKDLTTS